MFTIQLNKLQLHGHHGMHTEEGLAGGDFEVSLSLSFPAEEKITQLEQTIDYVEVYHRIRKHFDKPYMFLETLATDIVEDVSALDKRIKMINITISKLNAPIANFKGNVAVNFSKTYE